MLKSGNILAKKLYENDETLKSITDEEYAKYSQYESDELYDILKKEEKENYYDYLKDEHEKKEYVFFAKDKAMLKKQLNDIKDKFPEEIYTFLLKVVNNNDSDLNPSYFLVSKIVNAFLGKDSLTHYGHDGGLLQVVTITPAIKKHLDKLIEFGDNRKLENAYFDSLDVEEYDDYFQAYELYTTKYVMDENIDIKIEKE